MEKVKMVLMCAEEDILDKGCPQRRCMDVVKRAGG